MYLYRFPLAALLAGALAVSSPGIVEAKKPDSNKKQSSSRVVKRSAPPAARASVSRSAPSRVVRHSSGNANRHVATVRHSSGNNKPSKHVALARQSRDVDRRVATSSAAARQQVKAVPQTQLAARSNKINRDRIDRDRAINRSAGISRSDRRDEIVRRSTADVRRDRNRSYYVRRHEHHSADWYRSNGWWYDRDYYHSHHAHRYYNDTLGIFIIDNFGPSYYSDYAYGPYGYGYSEPATSYYGGYSGLDYETRVAVQQALANAGYYNGPIDGVIGPGTRAAIARYQEDYSLSVTGVIDDSLIQSLGLY